MNNGNIVLSGTPIEIIKKMDEEFSKKFLGEEVFINILDRFRVSQIPYEKNVDSNLLLVDGSSTLKTALSLMVERGVKSLGVNDKDGNVLGSITIESILNVFSSEEEMFNEK